jgi:hypothetical protein
MRVGSVGQLQTALKTVWGVKGKSDRWSDSTLITSSLRTLPGTRGSEPVASSTRAPSDAQRHDGGAAQPLKETRGNGQPERRRERAQRRPAGESHDARGVAVPVAAARGRRKTDELIPATGGRSPHQS